MTQQADEAVAVVFGLLLLIPGLHRLNKRPASAAGATRRCAQPTDMPWTASWRAVCSIRRWSSGPGTGRR